MEDEILPPSSTDALAESTASTAVAADNIDITVTRQLQLNTFTATNNITTTANTTTPSDTATTTDAGSTVTTTTTAAAAVATAMNSFATASTTTTASVHVLPSSSTTMTNVTMMTNAPIVTSANDLIVSTSKSYTPAISRSAPMVSTVLSGSTVNLPVAISKSSPTVSRNPPVTCSNITITSSERSATVVSISSCTSSVTNVPLLSPPLSTNTAIPASISTPVVQGNRPVASHVHMQTSSVLQLHGMLGECRTYVVNHVLQLATYIMSLINIISLLEKTLIP